MYRSFTEADAIEYAKSIPDLFAEDAELVNHEIGDGNLNLVFHVIDQKSGKSVILKQALPYARVVGESWPLTLDRARIEAEALQLQGELVPNLVPKLYRFDKELALTAMEDLSDHIILRKGLIQANLYPHLAEDIAHFLAQTLFFTSEYYLLPAEKKVNVVQFMNPELCDITEGLVFTDPYYDADTNSFNPLIQKDVEAIWGDGLLKRDIAQLKERFMTTAQALVHGDLHTGSIFVKENSTKVIDPEFAFYGPIGFDIGAIIANLYLSYAAHHVYNRRSYQAWLLSTAEKIWLGFANEFRILWKEHVKDEMWTTPGFIDDVLEQIFQDSIGFAGCKMMRRVIGLASVADLESIEDQQKRADAERFALLIGKNLVRKRTDFHSISDVTKLLQAIEPEQVMDR